MNSNTNINTNSDANANTNDDIKNYNNTIITILLQILTIILGLSSPSIDKDDVNASKDTWDASTGIDKLIQSLSGTNVASLDNQSFLQSALSSAFCDPTPKPLSSEIFHQEPASTLKAVLKPSPETTCVLSVSAVVDGDIKVLSSELPKTTFSTVKKPLLKKSLGARKLSGSNVDVKIESFESVEERASKVPLLLIILLSSLL